MCREEYLLCMILQGSDNTRFYQLKIDLVNCITMVQDHFPKTMVETQRLLNNCKTPPRQQCVKGSGSKGVAFLQNEDNPAPSLIGTIKCWHRRKKRHYKSNCPELQVQELGVGMKNLSINICEEAHSLFLADEGWMMVQEEEKEKRGVQGILSERHVYINMCASYTNTPYPHLIEYMEKQALGLIGHSNAGSSRMDTAGEMRAIKQMSLNKGGIATIVPLKILEKIWPVTYDSRCFGGLFTNQGSIILKNNSK
jgi:hypothetical protein